MSDEDKIFQPSSNVWGTSDGEGGGGTAFHDIEAGAYPFVMCAMNDETLVEVWRTLVTGPGAVQIPALKKQFGGPVRTRIYFNTGYVIETRPDGATTLFDLRDELDEIHAMIRGEASE